MLNEDNDTIKIIAYDTSEDANDLSLICADCAETEGDMGGSPMREGTVWGTSSGHFGECRVCGEIPEGLCVE